MKTLIIASLLAILAAVFSNGCQEDTPSEPQLKNLYLEKIIGYGQFCKYRVYENFHRETVIDTICIQCSENTIDSLYNEPPPCVNEKDFRFVREQEYNLEDSSITWRPLYIEKIPGTVFDCSYCPWGKKTYKKTYFLGNTQ